MGFNRIEEQHQRPFWQVIVVVFISIVITNNLITLCNYIDAKFVTPASLLVLLMMTFICARFVIGMLTFYLYTIFEQNFSVEKCLGKKHVLLNRVSLEKVVDFYKLGERESKEYPFKIIKKCYHGFKRDTVYCLIYRENEEYICLQIKPGRRIVNFMEMYDLRKKDQKLREKENKNWVK